MLKSTFNKFMKIKKKRDTDCLSCSIFFTKMMTRDPALFIEHWLPYYDLKMWLDLKLHFAPGIGEKGAVISIVNSMLYLYY